MWIVARMTGQHCLHQVGGPIRAKQLAISRARLLGLRNHKIVRVKTEPSTVAAYDTDNNMVEVPWKWPQRKECETEKLGTMFIGFQRKS